MSQYTSSSSPTTVNCGEAIQDGIVRVYLNLYTDR